MLLWDDLDRLDDRLFVVERRESSMPPSGSTPGMGDCSITPRVDVDCCIPDVVEDDRLLCSVASGRSIPSSSCTCTSRPNQRDCDTPSETVACEFCDDSDRLEDRRPREDLRLSRDHMDRADRLEGERLDCEGPADCDDRLDSDRLSCDAYSAFDPSSANLDQSELVDLEALSANHVWSPLCEGESWSSS